MTGIYSCATEQKKSKAKFAYANFKTDWMQTNVEIFRCGLILGFMERKNIRMGISSSDIRCIERKDAPLIDNNIVVNKGI